MKIDSIGINVYRQAISGASQDNKPSAKITPQAENNVCILIPGQDVEAPSRLAVKLPRGAFANLLTPEEDQAIRLAFQKYDLSVGRKSAPEPKGPDSHLGNNIDVKL